MLVASAPKAEVDPNAGAAGVEPPNAEGVPMVALPRDGCPKTEPPDVLGAFAAAARPKADGVCPANAENAPPPPLGALPPAAGGGLANALNPPPVDPNDANAPEAGLIREDWPNAGAA